jgi:hypothetical protein
VLPRLRAALLATWCTTFSDTESGLSQVRRLGLRRETEAAVRAAELPNTPGDFPWTHTFR